MIFYFSATGNSLHVARTLQRSFPGELQDMARCLREDKRRFTLEEGEKTFLVFPLYFWGMPTPVEDFLQRTEFETEGEVVALITCGGFLGGGDHSLRSLLEKKGFPRVRIFDLAMVTNYILAYTLPPLEAQKEQLEKADRRLAKILRQIWEGDPGYKSFPLIGALSKVVYGIYRNGRKTRPFHATEKCIACGKCERECPVGAIRMEEGKPLWKDPQCALCLGCLHRCPTGAIEYGNKTKGKARYRYPEQL